MEPRSPQHGHIIEINVDVPQETRSRRRSKVCDEVPCGLSDSSSTSRDSLERYASMRKLIIVVVLCAFFMTVEIVGGIYANSLAILTDAAHLLSDVAAFAISLFSLWAAGWEATPRQSYGFFRIEILGALVSMQLIWLLTGILVYEAIVRLINETTEVNGFLMFIVAAFGLVVNISMAVLLGHDHAGHSHGDHSHGVTLSAHTHGHGHGHGHSHGDDRDCHIEEHSQHDTERDHSENGKEHQHAEHDNEHHHAGLDTDEKLSIPLLDGKNEHIKKKKKKRNINIQGAYLHVLGDSIQSIGVMIAGGIIWYKPSWKIVDTICTLLFSVIVLATTLKMLRSILEVLMESTPREIDATKLETGLLGMEEVIAIHELHIWAITVGKVLLACHVKVRPEADTDMVLDKVISYIKREYNISHVTIQIER